MTPVVVAPLPGGGSFELRADRPLTAADAAHVLRVLDVTLPDCTQVDAEPEPQADPSGAVLDPRTYPPRVPSFGALAQNNDAPKAQDSSR